MHGKAAEPTTYPRAFTPHYTPLTAPALDGIASERFAGTGSDGGCRTLLAEVPAGRMPSLREVEGRQWCHGRFRAARGRSSPHGEPGCLRRNVRGFGSVDLDCGDKPSPSGGRSERSAGGQALRFRGRPRGPPERGGNVRSRRRGPTSQTLRTTRHEAWASPALVLTGSYPEATWRSGAFACPVDKPDALWHVPRHFSSVPAGSGREISE